MRSLLTLKIPHIIMRRSNRKGIALSIAGFLLVVHAFGRNYAVVNYQRSNGFPSNKVYGLWQDAQGYIWAGTENGLVSFNGYAFKTYTTKDGLPDNEVFGFKEDRMGRLWILTFSNELCYFWKGKIYNSGNDTLLYRLKFASRPSYVEFDNLGNTWVLDGSGSLMHVDNQNKITRITRIGNDIFSPGGTAIAVNDWGKLILINGDMAYLYNSDHFEPIEIPQIKRHTNYDHLHRLAMIRIQELKGIPVAKWAQPHTIGSSFGLKGQERLAVTHIQKIAPDLVAVVLQNNAYFINTKTGERNGPFLKGYTVSWCLLAHDGSFWLATLGNGLFHYSPSFIQSVPVAGKVAPVLFIKAQKKNLNFIQWPRTLVRMQRNAGKQYDLISQGVINNGYLRADCHYIGNDNMGNWISCGVKAVKAKTPGGKKIAELSPGHCKYVWEEGNKYLLAGTVEGIYRIDKDRFAITDTLYGKRVTCITGINDTIYAGTLNGLLSFHAGKRISLPFLAQPVFKTHITALTASADSVLWVANNMAVLTGVCNGRVIKTIGEQEGLICNSISAMRVSDRFLWIGTGNGLYAFDKKPPYNIIRHLSAADGLLSDQITYLDITDDIVHVGTDRGLNYFDEREIVQLYPPSKFIVTNIWNEKHKLHPGTEVMQLGKGTLQVDFDVIDHSGITKLMFAYRLNKEPWISIPNNSLYFPTVPYGHFTVYIRARATHWAAPRVIKLSFYRPYPYYLQPWFLLMLGFFLLFFTGSSIYFLIKWLRQKDRKRLMVQLNLLELEQMALQGQMNPHFIFNCISSIKQYYNSGEIVKANKLLDTFTTLIRATFEMSAQTFTTLAEELKYLEQYLAIEQERFSHSFEFAIVREISTLESQIPVPAMLLQPLVENAVRHGIRHLPDGTGKIGITVMEQEAHITITIADNGIGRERSREMKRNMYFQEAVTSTSVNEKRIDILNKLFDRKISMHTDDILNERKQVTGTIVLIAYPLNIHNMEQ